MSRRGALQTDELALAETLSALGRPAVSPDGWIVVPYGRLVGLRRDERVDVVSRSPRGQLVRTALAGSFGVDALAAAVTRGGAGVVATRRSGATAAVVDQVFPLRAGRPLSAGSLTRPPHGYSAIGPAATANPVDRARVLLSTPTRLLAARWR